MAVIIEMVKLSRCVLSMGLKLFGTHPAAKSILLHGMKIPTYLYSHGSPRLRRGMVEY
jgi:hypothetical protein